MEPATGKDSGEVDVVAAAAGVTTAAAAAGVGTVSSKWQKWLPDVNPFKRPMNALQKQWYRVLIARRVGFGPPRVSEDKTPTYANLCQKRYKAAFRHYNEQFRNEIAQHEAQQPSAIDAMRVHRTFAITTLWLPLHSRHEISMTLNQLEMVLSVKERRRLEHILRYECQRGGGFGGGVGNWRR